MSGFEGSTKSRRTRRRSETKEGAEVKGGMGRDRDRWKRDAFPTGIYQERTDLVQTPWMAGVVVGVVGRGPWP